jgi:putative heme iron utilization protein
LQGGTLKTSLAGQPFASLVTPATAPDLGLLLLLSSLSEHTRHLRAEPRCSVLVVGAATGSNPQTAPRATITGLAEMLDDPALKARYLAVHPYASLYAGFGDFALWRIRPMRGLFVGGFARAARLRLADLTPEPSAVAAIAAADSGIMAHCNADHLDALARLPARRETGGWSRWTWMAAILRKGRAWCGLRGRRRLRRRVVCGPSWFGWRGRRADNRPCIAPTRPGVSDPVSRLADRPLCGPRPPNPR